MAFPIHELYPSLGKTLNTCVDTSVTPQREVQGYQAWIGIPVGSMNTWTALSAAPDKKEKVLRNL